MHAGRQSVIDVDMQGDSQLSTWTCMQGDSQSLLAHNQGQGIYYTVCTFSPQYSGKGQDHTREANFLGHQGLGIIANCCSTNGTNTDNTYSIYRDKDRNGTTLNPTGNTDSWSANNRQQLTHSMHPLAGRMKRV